MKLLQTSSLIATFLAFMTATVLAEDMVRYNKLDVSRFIAARGSMAELLGTSPLIITSRSANKTAADVLVDGVTCQGNGPNNYVCSSDKVTYGCTAECKCCFYEEATE